MPDGWGFFLVAIIIAIVAWTIWFTAPCDWFQFFPTGDIPPRCISYFGG